MSLDLAIRQMTNGGSLFDVGIGEQDLLFTEGMETAVAVLLFTDARAASSEVMEPSLRRGWVGNIFAKRELGGKLWLAEQVRNVQEVRNKIKVWAENSLQPLLDDGIVADIEVTVQERDARSINLIIEILAKDNQREKFKYRLSTNFENLVTGEVANAN